MPRTPDDHDGPEVRLSRDPIARATAETALQLGRDVAEIHGPIWNARRDLAKTLISLSSGALVLTVTFLSNAASQLGVEWWKYTLYVSWILFLGTTVAAVLSLWKAVDLNTLSARIHNLSSDFPDALATSAEHSAAGVNHEALELFLKAMRPIATSEKWSHTLLRVGLVLFILALASLGVFGWTAFTGNAIPG